jgi:hypothetical protein
MESGVFQQTLELFVEFEQNCHLKFQLNFHFPSTGFIRPVNEFLTKKILHLEVKVGRLFLYLRMLKGLYMRPDINGENC